MMVLGIGQSSLSLSTPTTITEVVPLNSGANSDGAHLSLDLKKASTGAVGRSFLTVRDSWFGQIRSSMVAFFDERECQLKVKGDANLWPTYIRLDNTPILLFMGISGSYFSDCAGILFNLLRGPVFMYSCRSKIF